MGVPKNFTNSFVSNFKVTDAVTKAKRDLILSILKSTATKRETREYLNKYRNQFDFCNTRPSSTQTLSTRKSQRDLFVNRFLLGVNPFLGIYDEDETKLSKILLRLAVFKMKVGDITSQTYLGIAETFKRLIHLGISPIILLDPESLPNTSYKMDALSVRSQALQLLQLLSESLDNGMNSLESTVVTSLFTKKGNEIIIGSSEQLLIPIYQGIIPIVIPTVFDELTTRISFVNPNDALLSLCSGLQETPQLLSIEKIILIDELGGVPSVERNQSSHVFINLSQEFSDIVSELYIGFLDPKVRDQHLSNLKVMNRVLELSAAKTGSNETTGIITTPEIMSINDDQMNPIIYNVLTDRPVISSSLPSSRKRTPRVSTSIIKKGFPVSVFDEHSFVGDFTLENLVKQKCVDVDRLFDLMDDSFGKTLDRDGFFKRINQQLATVIIVGDYDGAAIITWEPLEDGGRIAYLDKFAIAKKNQGLPSLADIIFKLISQSHPNEMIWRSRLNNPVNKWYFERCRGSLNVENTPWKLFFYWGPL